MRLFITQFINLLLELSKLFSYINNVKGTVLTNVSGVFLSVWIFSKTKRRGNRIATPNDTNMSVQQPSDVAKCYHLDLNSSSCVHDSSSKQPSEELAGILSLKETDHPNLTAEVDLVPSASMYKDPFEITLGNELENDAPENMNFPRQAMGEEKKPELHEEIHELRKEMKSEMQAAIHYLANEIRERLDAIETKFCQEN